MIFFLCPRRHLELSSTPSLSHRSWRAINNFKCNIFLAYYSTELSKYGFLYCASVCTPRLMWVSLIRQRSSNCGFLRHAFRSTDTIRYHFMKEGTSVIFRSYCIDERQYVATDVKQLKQIYKLSPYIVTDTTNAVNHRRRWKCKSTARKFNLVKLVQLLINVTYQMSLVSEYKLNKKTNCSSIYRGARGTVVGWGTMLQAGRSRVRSRCGNWIFQLT
jgi:hypothetical protein